MFLMKENPLDKRKDHLVEIFDRGLQTLNLISSVQHGQN